MEIRDALDHLKANGTGVLSTLRPDGSPHLSVVMVAVVDDQLWISATQDRVKTRNVRRDPRVSFLSGLGPWKAVDGIATLHEGDDVLDMLRLYYRTARGEHEDWDDYDAAMIRDRRLIIAVEPQRAYGF